MRVDITTKNWRTDVEYLPIDPIEELLKAIGIVHGPIAEAAWRRIVKALRKENKNGHGNDSAEL